MQTEPEKSNWTESKVEEAIALLWTICAILALMHDDDHWMWSLFAGALLVIALVNHACALITAYRAVSRVRKELRAAIEKLKSIQEAGRDI